MRFFLIVIIVILIRPTSTFAQVGLSRDGKYVWSVNHIEHQKKLTIESIKGNWKKEINCKWTLTDKLPVFSWDCKRLICQMGDSLYVLQLGTENKIALSGIKSFEQSNGPKTWLAYQLKTAPGELSVQDISFNKILHYKDVKSFKFDEAGNTLLLSVNSQNNQNNSSLAWVTLANLELKYIWKVSDGQTAHEKLVNYTINSIGDQVAFILQGEQKLQDNAIWCFNKGMDKPTLLADSTNNGIDSGLYIANESLTFNKDGTKIFFKLKEKNLPAINKDMVKLDVWSYLDPLPQFLQLQGLYPHIYAAVVCEENKHIIRLEKDNEHLLDMKPEQIVKNDNYALVCHFDHPILNYSNGRVQETYSLATYNWNKDINCSVFLVSLKDGSRVKLRDMSKLNSSFYPYYRFAPEGKFIIFYKPEVGKYFSYEISTGSIHDITKDAKTKWNYGNSELIRERQFNSPVGVAAWFKTDTALLIYDYYGDLWRIDPFGRKKALNITNGFAKRNSIFDSFGEILNGEHYLSPTKFILDSDTGYIMGCINTSHNFNFYKQAFNKKSNPRLVLNGTNYAYTYFNNAANNIAVFQRQSYTEPPRSLYTNSFKAFTLINKDSLNYEKPVKKETIKWKTLDGINSVGILYYPQNFDPQKKYPVIFSFYEQAFVTSDMNKFMSFEKKRHELDTRACNENDLITHGYFNFVPDVYSKIGETREEVYNSLFAAAKYLSNRPYVDAKHLGLYGYSFSSFQINQLIARTNIFAAACSESGMSDLISFGGTESLNAYDHAALNEVGQNVMGATLWQRPDLYLKNSPIFYANRIATPLLLGIGRKEHTVPPQQGIELFTALRRLGKKVWLISYDDLEHSLGYQNSDWGIRTMQFFDHYLKGSPAPVWMTRGIPAKMRGHTLGLELDTTIKTPGPGLLMKEEVLTPRQKELLKHRTTVDINGRIVNVKTKEK